MANALISMADIARLAGQRRATVGNWKSRHADFPPERGRSPRGPLYDRAEIMEWLVCTDRLDERPPEVAAIWQLARRFKGDLDEPDLLATILVVLALRTKCSTAQWERLLNVSSHDVEPALRELVHTLFPFADVLIHPDRVPAEAARMTLETVRNLDEDRVSMMVDAVFDEAARKLDHRSGEYLTPSSVRRLVLALARPAGVVYNPSSRTGQLMIDAAAASGGDITRLVGQEANSRVAAMARLNLAIHRVAAEVEAGDLFAHDAYPQLRADCVVSIPPWNVALPDDQQMADDARWVWGEPGRNGVNAAWIQHCLYHLAGRGRCVVVLPERALVEGGRAGRIRRRIVKAGLLDAVIGLPAGLFSATSMRFAVLVLSKASSAPETLMVDLSESGRGRSSEALPTSVIDQTARAYHDWRSGQSPNRANRTVASFDDIAANDFVIDPVRYQPVIGGVPDLEQTTRKAAELRQRLAGLITASRQADNRLQAVLKAPG
jgi:hypothetical protein